MIIISASSEDEALDLAEILGAHLVWPYKIYLRGGEFRPLRDQPADAKATR